MSKAEHVRNEVGGILISIVVPFFNSQRYIDGAVSTIKAQTHANFEAIFVDDCSQDDGTEYFIRSVGEDARFRLLRNDVNRGPSYCRNVGIQAARGNFIAFLDVDDEWHQEKLAVQLAAMISSNATLSCTRYRHMSHDGSRLGMPVYVPRRITFRNHALLRPIGCSTVVVDKKVLGPNGPFPADRDVPTGEDYVAWAALLRSGVRAIGCQEVLCNYRLAHGSRSSNYAKKWIAMRSAFRRVLAGHPVLGVLVVISYPILAAIKRLLCFPFMARH